MNLTPDERKQVIKALQGRATWMEKMAVAAAERGDAFQVDRLRKYAAMSTDLMVRYREERDVEKV